MNGEKRTALALAEGVDVEEGECLVCFEELEAGDIACCGRGGVSVDCGGRPTTARAGALLERQK